MDDSCGFSFWLGRLTEPITRVHEKFTGADGAVFKKGMYHVCVQYLERTPPESPFVFVLSETEVYVDVKSVFACDIDPSNRVGCSVILSQIEVTRIQQQLLNFLHS